jgi:periplasmic copper chaperone A
VVGWLTTPGIFDICCRQEAFSDPGCRATAIFKAYLPNACLRAKRKDQLTRFLTIAAALFLAAPIHAHEVTVGDLQIIHPHIPQPAKSAKAAGGFMAIVNNGAGPDRLIAIESDVAMKVELHESKVDTNGVGTMTHVEALDIPAGATVSLEHGGYHIMFMGLKGPLTEGEMVKGALIFEKAGRVEIEFQIDPPGRAGHDHSGSSPEE